ncbi:hypothetical protein EZH22_24665 [Xanthobacter dioxanivorans]|uniref:Uncharacterized protein n=1 Tax=Xanthobacter dioxanivorans TaxID=2528964 RepID=A0A974SJ90_9HYPH|nr:hypothetical protein [Xanthobacter dioxanivorans]QRG06143.1 hypothetical protein EZH22_24665 [Xanthobacter dioxanivorans]
MTSDIDPKALALKVAETCDRISVEAPDDVYLSVSLYGPEARALAAFLREAVSPWNFDMDAAPKDGTDLDLFDGIGVVQGAFTWPQSLEEWWETVGEEDEVPDTEGYREYLEGEMFGWIGCETLSTDVLYLSPIAWRHRPSPPVLPTPPAAGGGE